MNETLEHRAQLEKWKYAYEMLIEIPNGMV
jgi:hypothetical protein